jgi:apolipoprotein D and lipocalin family protein
MMKKIVASFLLIGTVLAAPSIAANPSPPEAVRRLELGQFLGLWHEIARLPLFSQNDCTESTTNYSLRTDGDIKIDNHCVRVKKNGTRKDSNESARAWVVDERTNAKFKVRFVWWLPFVGDSDYWVLKLDPNYKIAMIGTPDYKHLWLLAREPKMARKTFNEWISYAKSLGYPTDNLIVSNYVK